MRTVKRRNKRLAVAFVVAIILGWLFYSHGKLATKSLCFLIQSPVSTAEVEHPIISLIVPLSGSFARDGEMFKKGAKIAWKEIHKKEGVGKLEIYDGNKEPKVLCSLIQRLVRQNNILAVVVHLPVRGLSLIIPTLEKGQLPTLVPAISHQSLYHYNWIFPMLPSDRMEGFLAAKVIWGWDRKGRSRVGVVRFAGGYGEVVESGFRLAAKQLNLTYKCFYVRSDSDSMDSWASRVIKEGFNILWVVGPPASAAEFVEALLEQGYRGRILLPHTFSMVDPGDVVREGSRKLYMLSPIVPEDGGNRRDNFVADFRRQYWQEPDELSMLAYDAVSWLGQCLCEGVRTRLALKKCLVNCNSATNGYHGCAGVFYFVNGLIHHPLAVVPYYRGGHLLP